MTDQAGATAPGLGRAGALVRLSRLRAGMSLRGLAGRIGVSAGTLSAIENGKTPVTLDRLDRIAAELGTTTLEILRTPHAEAAGNVGAAIADSPGGGSWRAFEPLGLDPPVQAAIDTFVTMGYHGATMRIIAAKADMSVAGIYHYYPSKQHLLVAVLDLAMAELLWRIPAARAAGVRASEKFANVVEVLALFHTFRSDLAFIGATEMRSLDEPDRTRITLRRDEVQHILDDAIAAGIAAAEFATPHPREAARAIATMCTSLPQWFQPDGPITPNEIARRYAEFAIDMVRGHPVPVGPA